jgi:hypothetical protein
MRDYTTEELEWEYHNEYVKRAWKIWPHMYRNFAEFVIGYHKAPIKLIDARFTRLNNFSGPYEDCMQVVQAMSHRRDVHRIIRGIETNNLPPPLLIGRTDHQYYVMSGNTRLAVASAMRCDIACKILEVR